MSAVDDPLYHDAMRDLASARARVSKLEGVLREVYAHMPARAEKMSRLIENALGLPHPAPRSKKPARRSARRRR